MDKAKVRDKANRKLGTPLRRVCPAQSSRLRGGRVLYRLKRMDISGAAKRSVGVRE